MRKRKRKAEAKFEDLLHHLEIQMFLAEEAYEKADWAVRFARDRSFDGLYAFVLPTLETERSQAWQTYELIRAQVHECRHTLMVLESSKVSH